jgi:hypothetical protein
MTEQPMSTLLDDERTKPIARALISSIGYIHGQSINNAGAQTATIKAGIEALRELQGTLAEVTAYCRERAGNPACAESRPI